VCLQETKLVVIDRFIVGQCLGPSFDGFDYLPADDTRGGILLAWNSNVLDISNVVHDTYSITGEVRPRAGGVWWITVVYGPQNTADKIAFLAELTVRRTLCPGAWMLIGDFNMILRASEKNNDNLHRNIMGRFRDFVDDLELREIYMHGRLFTWSNQRQHPTMSRLDRALVSIDWELSYPDSLLQALSSAVSDHTPLHLSLNACCKPKKRFRFELFWLKLDSFDDAVRAGWKCEEFIVDPFLRLDACFRNLATYLQAWSASKVGNIKLQIAMANILIHRFEVAQEARELSLEEE
jgi:hypothetical protein